MKDIVERLRDMAGNSDMVRWGARGILIEAAETIRDLRGALPAKHTGTSDFEYCGLPYCSGHVFTDSPTEGTK